MLFCEIHPICYEISLKKEICKRHIKDLLSDEKFAKEKCGSLLPNVVASYSCNLIKRGKGVDLRLQENKAVNIRLACEKLDSLIMKCWLKSHLRQKYRSPEHPCLIFDGKEQ